MPTLQSIVKSLAKHHQRATYGAVAELLGRAPRSVLQGSPRTWEHSWVVNQDSGEPGGYPAGMVHPALKERDHILVTGEELATWLASVEESPI